jgi:hypothetical protein
MGLKDTNSIYISKEKVKPHIIRVNGPIEVERDSEDQSIMKIDFLYSGLQQMKIYSPEGVEVYSKDFDIESQGDYVVLTRYGDKSELELKLY